MPILDADGMPVVRTVGDLTARHVGRLIDDGNPAYDYDPDALLAILDGEAGPTQTNVGVTARSVSAEFADGRPHEPSCGLEDCECPDHEWEAQHPKPAGTYVTLKVDRDIPIGIRQRWMLIEDLRLGLYAEATADQLAAFVPVLDADGVPVVTTVGDLTARHIGRMVRVDYGGGEAEVIIVERVKHYGYGTNLGDGCGYLDLDTTCELLP